MQIGQLEIEGYRSYGERQVIKFLPGNLYILTGENRDRGKSSAAGKSSIFKAITTVLFDENDDDSTNDRAINTIMPELGCRIALSFIDDYGNHFYVVYARQHPVEGTHWTLYRWNGSEWEPKKGAREKDTKKIIHDVVKMTYDQFVNQAYIPQSKVADFIGRTDKERKEIFGNILGLDECDRYSKAASEWRKETEKHLSKGEGALALLQRQVENSRQAIPTVNVEQDKERLEAIKTRFEDVRVRVEELDAELEKLKVIAELKTKEKLLTQQSKNAERKVQAAYSQLFMKSSEVLSREHEGLIEQVEDLRQRCAEVDADYNLAEKNLRKSQALSDVCVECEQKIPHDNRKEQVRRYQLQFNTLKTKKEGLEQARDAARDELADNENNLRDCQQKEIQYYTYHSQWSAIIKDLTEVQASIAEIQGVVGNGIYIPGEIAAERDTLLEERLTLSTNITVLSMSLDTYQQSLDTLAQLELALAKQQKYNQDQEKLVNQLKRCEEIIGDKGFKSYKIHSSRDSFNNSVAEYLSILTEGEVQAELVTEVPKADGKGTKTELDILVQDGAKKQVPIRQYSGGEKSSIGLAITGAFGDLSKEQAESNVNLLLLDEPFANLDSYGEGQMCKLLEKLTEDDRIVLVVTNHLGVKDKAKFDREIRAVKENHISRIEEYDLSEEH